MTDVDVVVVADEGDEHAAAVIAELDSLGVETIRFNLSDLRQVRSVARPGATDFLLAGDWRRVSRQTTVWWRRTGTVGVEDLGGEESRLVVDEGPHLLRGAFSAAGVRWVDNPHDVERAELKLLQLTYAAGLGIAIPSSLVTNDPSEGRAFLRDRRVVAKPLSPGVGIVPYVAEVLDEDLETLAAMPTLVQELVHATADLRVVVVNGEAWTWRRARSDRTLDWRAEDPDGSRFEPVEAEVVCRRALQLTASLRLTMSVQDWLETPDGPVFLEVNPQGAWLFLSGSREKVMAPLARHLAYGPIESSGHWPRAIKRFGQDFLPSAKAPENDGVEAPACGPLDWVDEVAARPEALETARRATDHAELGAKAAEEKASRLVQTALALLTIALALGAFQLAFVLDRSWPWIFALAPIGTAVTCLALAAFEALEIDRVGVYQVPNATMLAGIGTRDPAAVLIAEEEKGRRLAAWTSTKKHSDLMQARAWFSRGLAALVLAAIVAGAARAAVKDSSRAPPTLVTPGSSPVAPDRPVDSVLK